jgi:hypothetical protein
VLLSHTGFQCALTIENRAILICGEYINFINVQSQVSNGEPERLTMSCLEYVNRLINSR